MLFKDSVLGPAATKFVQAQGSEARGQRANARRRPLGWWNGYGSMSSSSMPSMLARRMLRIGLLAKVPMNWRDVTEPRPPRISGGGDLSSGSQS